MSSARRPSRCRPTTHTSSVTSPISMKSRSSVVN
jgi:hypothetical protein